MTAFKAGQGRTRGNRRIYERTNAQPYIRKYQSLSVPEWDLKRWSKDVKLVVIYDRFSCTQYVADAKLFRQAKPRNTDWGLQRFVDIDHFNMVFGEDVED